jgi:hypothetical protein
MRAALSNGNLRMGRTRTSNVERSISNLEGHVPTRDRLCNGRGGEGTSAFGVGRSALDIRRPFEWVLKEGSPCELHRFLQHVSWPPYR